MGSDEFEFANDVRAAIEERAPKTAWVILGAVFAVVGSALGWANWAVVEESTTGDGRVIPSRQLQLVQTLEGGVLRSITVEEGAIVEADQVLIEIDDTSLAARLGELIQRQLSLRASLARTEAEAESSETFIPPDALVTRAPAAIAAERSVFVSRRLQLTSTLEVIRQRQLQKRQEVEELEAQEQKLVATLKPLERELKLTRDLKSRGAVPEIELLRLERQYAEIAGELLVVRAARPRAAAAVEEANSEFETKKAVFRTEARVELSKTIAELAVIDEQVKAATDRVGRTALKSPVRGVVNKLNVATVGGVVQPGQVLVEIVPLDDTLLIEARVRPQDVAFIHPGQDASVKITAYDYRIFGGLDGQVERIGADTIADENGETFYRVVIRTDQTHLAADGKKLPIIPGMVATVDILSGEKTVLDYILKPISTIRHEALRER